MDVDKLMMVMIMFDMCNDNNDDKTNKSAVTLKPNVGVSVANRNTSKCEKRTYVCQNQSAVTPRIKTFKRKL
jgi:hypothetical protein